MKVRNGLIALATMAAVVVSSVANGQVVTYPDPVLSSYQVTNLDTKPQNITVQYYNATGGIVKTATFSNVPANGVKTVQQALESDLANGSLSAVLSSGGPLAAIVNQQLGKPGSGTSIAPFSSYSAAGKGSKSVTIPVIMHNWFGYYTTVFIQNVGGAAASNIQVSYKPTKIGSCTTGAAGQTDSVTSLAQFASKDVAQVNKTALGAPDASGCSAFKGRFLGSATITSDQDISVVVNQTVQDKLFTYNGFTTSGTNLVVPAYLRNWFNYYASLTLANPGATAATVTVTYRPGTGANPSTETVATKTVPAGESIVIFDGPTATADQSDLLTKYPYGTNNRFFGSVKLVSTQPIVAMVNQEATLAAGNQAGAYNVPIATEGSKKISVPLIQSDFFGYYTSLTIATVDGAEAKVKITYTSDGEFSSVKNTSKSYEMDTVNGFLNRYEGSSATAAQSDLLDDPAWEGGGTGRFIGSAVVEVVSGSNIVAFVNSESNTAPSAATRDSMYTYNAVNQ